MKKCKTHLSDCLRSVNIYPTARSKSVYDTKGGFVAEHALFDNTTEYFASDTAESNQWWSIDFKTRVIITGYQIKGGNECNWINSWTIFLSDDNADWTSVSSKSDYPGDVIYPIEYNVPI